MPHAKLEIEGAGLAMRLSVLTLTFVALVLAAAGTASAQAPTGTISGHVISADGEPLPGVTVSAAGANLQGSRTTVTSANGDYLLPLLPPGEYTITFEIGNFEPVRQTRAIAGTQNSVVDISMSLSRINEAVTVVGEAAPFVDTAQVAINFKQNLMATLPSNRTVDAVLLMSPSMHASGPRGAYTINGAQSYENLFTLDGAVITENLRGLPFTLYIEDALQETTVSSAGVSAEYGRFSGGVANAITKSGGNMFSGSFRTSFANDSWRSLTPYESTQLIANPALQVKIDKTVPTYEGTFGGPLKKEQLWFFVAGRKQTQQSARTTVFTSIPYIRTNDEKRYEGKLTYTPRSGQSIQGSLLKTAQVLKNNTGFNVMDIASLTNQGQPQDLYSVHYTGVVRPNLFLEAQYSARHLKFTDSGASTRDPIAGTLVFDLTRNLRYWSPTNCSGAVCDGDEQRNNSTMSFSGTTASTTRSGRIHTPLAAITAFAARRAFFATASCIHSFS
jgi:sarcosine oxidase gamma subunit